MLIGHLSKLSGFSKDTIRFYEKIGLISVPKQRSVNTSYKDYPVEILHSLRVIKKYKELGFTLEEIRELLVLQSIKVLDIAKLIGLMEIKITGLDEQIEKLHAVRMQLNREKQSLYEKQIGRIIELPEMRLAA